MKQYTVADSLGREITFDWEDDTIAPTDSDFEEVFKQADSFKPSVTPEPKEFPTTGIYQPKPGDIKSKCQSL